ncbi:MAG: hypothetical protein Faunusvirus1_21 [Faunusvirus sp.]|jgi:ankyrin repeat protein|uniref:Uncharacterized protein n=1 Tax=Faunusvirus sp. TaxID=2487766 RepID=A0A3G4ZYB6_9VIRU|nr:MAG: hypothetical protein Faunusvirus1_21 [Faunusvirus sp.]
MVSIYYIEKFEQYKKSDSYCLSFFKQNGVDDYKCPSGRYIAHELLSLKHYSTLEYVIPLLHKSAFEHLNAKGETALIAACQINYNTSIAFALLDRNCDINVMTPRKETALSAAIKTKNYDTVYKLIDRGADLNIQDENELDAFHLALRYGHRQLCHYMLQQSPKINVNTQYQSDINASYRSGHTSLMTAIYHGEFILFNAILDYGMRSKMFRIDLNIQDDIGNTAFIYACQKYEPIYAKVLLKYSPDINIVNKSGETALLHACINIYKIHDIVDQLIADNVKVAGVTAGNDHCSPIIAAYSSKRYDTALAMIQLHIKQHPDIRTESCCILEQTTHLLGNMLIYATKYGLDDIAVEIARHGCNLHHRDLYKWDAVMYADDYNKTPKFLNYIYTTAIMREVDDIDTIIGKSYRLNGSLDTIRIVISYLAG